MVGDEHIAPAADGLYYQPGYWNDFDEVVRYQRRLATDDPNLPWHRHLWQRNGCQPFRRALVLNAGTGWVERDLLRDGVVKAVFGIDWLPQFVAEAQRAADAEGFDTVYTQVDTNTFDWSSVPNVDLVLNFAAGHHIAYLDRTFRACRELLLDGGTYVMWDYAGPHRNQYGSDMWAAMEQANNSLPMHLRKTMAYPHLATMLATDPSEAVHSELLLEVTKRYFDFSHLRPVGGTVAYEVITHNPAFFASGKPAQDTTHFVGELLRLDEQVVLTDPSSSLFWYGIATPKAAIEERDLVRWTEEEARREAAAEGAGGQYYAATGPAQRLYGRSPSQRLRRQVVQTVRDPRRVAHGAEVVAGSAARKFRRVGPILGFQVRQTIRDPRRILRAPGRLIGRVRSGLGM